MAATAEKAKAKLEEIHQRQRQVVENLIGTYRGALQGLVPAAKLAGRQISGPVPGRPSRCWSRRCGCRPRGWVGPPGGGARRRRGTQLYALLDDKVADAEIRAARRRRDRTIH
jgi:hypothetical protein